MLIALMIGVVGVIGIISLDRINENIDLINSQGIEQIGLLNHADQNLLLSEIELEGIIWASQVTQNQTSIENAKAKIDQLGQENNELFEEFKQHDLNDKEKELLTEYEESIVNYREIRNQAIQYVQIGNYAQAVQ